MDIDSLTIGQARELAQMYPSPPSEPPQDVDDRGLVRLVVLQRGWVAVGRFYKDGSDCSLECAQIIRRWGTTRGLGELAALGPLENTKLDPAGTLRFHALTIVAQLDVKQDKWENL